MSELPVFFQNFFWPLLLSFLGVQKSRESARSVAAKVTLVNEIINGANGLADLIKKGKDLVQETFLAEIEDMIKKLESAMDE